jgi:DNA invertase Pin-like site-specific DNA recombinase
MMNFDEEVKKAEQRLQELKRQRAAAKRPPKPKSTRGRGRPSVDRARILLARKLARKHPITHVALVTGLSVATLYRNNIKRYVLDREN